MQGIYYRHYGVETTIDFTLYQTTGTELKVDAAHASGDTKIMKDEGNEANTTNAFTDEGQGYSIVLTATEMQAARIVVYVVDQGTKAWIDTALVIETYGHANAMYPIDFPSKPYLTGTDNSDGDIQADEMTGDLTVTISAAAIAAIAAAVSSEGFGAMVASKILSLGNVINMKHAKKVKFDYDGSDNIIYIGLHRDGHAQDNDPKHSIIQLTYDATNVTDINITEGSWTGRATLW